MERLPSNQDNPVAARARRPPIRSIMTRDEILRKHKQYLFPSLTNYYSDPVVAERASGQWLWDKDGTKFLDFFGGILTVSVGHANPRVNDKVKAQIDKLGHTST